jgi:hypothetical protein
VKKQRKQPFTTPCKSSTYKYISHLLSIKSLKVLLLEGMRWYIYLLEERTEKGSTIRGLKWAAIHEFKEY